MSNIKTFSFYVLSLLIMFFLFEVLASTLLIYFYRFNDTAFALRENGTLSSAVLVRKALDAISNKHEYDPEHFTVEPKPYFMENPTMGYYSPPGKYQVTFRKRIDKGGLYEYLKTKMTFSEDSVRWTGDIWNSANNSIYIFGDSFVSGYGVNDEQTFAYLLQQSMKNTNVKLLANAGYSLSQAFINFEHIKNSITENDILVIGYADFYKIRNVAAPSWTKTWGDPPSFLSSKLTYPKAFLDVKGDIQITHTPMFCKFDEEYCKRADPPIEEMDKVTVAILNHMARNTRGKIYLLHIQGDPNDQVLRFIDKRIHVISALPRDFDYVVMDDILGFDPHPGPWWHYAMFKKLTETLVKAMPGDIRQVSESAGN